MGTGNHGSHDSSLRPRNYEYEDSKVLFSAPATNDHLSLHNFRVPCYSRKLLTLRIRTCKARIFTAEDLCLTSLPLIKFNSSSQLVPTVKPRPRKGGVSGKTIRQPRRKKFQYV